MLRPAILAAILAAGMPVWGHDPITTKVTWSREVARIVYTRCLTCHKPAGPAFSLASYEQARPWAKAIKEEVLSRRMPPWNAVKGFGRFQNDRGLTQQELTVISDWVEGGAPEGDPRHMPSPPPPALERRPTAFRRITVSGSALLEHRVEAVGITVDAPVQVIAARPDGSIEPLVWVRRANPAAPDTYWFQSKIALPAGTHVQTVPSTSAAVLLIR